MRVECIKPFVNRVQSINYPEMGQIYTVRDRIGPDSVNAYGYHLVEIVNPLRHYIEGWNEAAFDVTAFRPITDISDLQKLTKVRELEDA